MSTAVEILEFSRDLIKKGWVSSCFAQDSDGEEVDPGSPNACSFCALGALIRAMHVLKSSSDVSKQAEGALGKSLSPDFLNVIHFNDAQHSEEPVVDLFDRAIASLKESA